MVAGSTERVRPWRCTEQWSLADFAAARLIGARWQQGTRWTGGLGDDTIEHLERRYGLRFPPQHRLFLQMLHSTTPWRREADYARYGDRLALREVPGFYDWLHDEPQIRAALRDVAGVMDQLPLDDQPWQQAWLGRAPIPGLIPIFGHRYVVGDESQWVLSIVGDDAVVYATNLHDYLLPS